MKRELTEKELQRITEAVARRDKVEAKNLYMSATECGLTEAQDFVRALTAKFEADNAER